MGYPQRQTPADNERWGAQLARNSDDIMLEFQRLKDDDEPRRFKGAAMMVWSGHRDPFMQQYFSTGKCKSRSWPDRDFDAHHCCPKEESLNLQPD